MAMMNLGGEEGSVPQVGFEHGTNISVLLIFDGGSGIGGAKSEQKSCTEKGTGCQIFSGVKTHSFE